MKTRSIYHQVFKPIAEQKYMKLIVFCFVISFFKIEKIFAQSIDAAILMGRYTTQKDDHMQLSSPSAQAFNKSYYNKKKKMVEQKPTNTRKPASAEDDTQLTLTTTKVVQPNTATGKKTEPVAPEEIKKTEQIASQVIDNKNEPSSVNDVVVTEIKEPTAREQMKQLFAGKGKDILLFYKENAHPDDLRNNKLEIELSPKYVSNNSKSNYYYRDYMSSYPALAVKTSIWFVPAFGLSGKFQFAFASAISGNPNDSSKVLTRNENLEFALNFRNYFSISRKANSLEFQILFLDTKMTVPTDEIYRYSFDSSGLGIGFKMKNPESVYLTTYYGMQFYPKLTHKESATGSSANSGTNRENSRIGVEYGKEYILGKDCVVSYGLELTNETNSFKGAVASPDPVSGFTPDGVSVSNSTIGFVLGYRWGR